MKVRWMLLAVIILSLPLTACDGGSDDPIKPVKDFYKAYFKTRDTEKAVNASCQRYRQDVRQFMEAFSDYEFEFGEIEYDLIGVKYEVTDKEENEATVRVTGKAEVRGTSVEGDLSESGLGLLQVVKENGEWVVCDDKLAELGIWLEAQRIQETFEDIMDAIINP